MFIKSFDEEIELLEKSKLTNKLELFSLYEDLFKFLVTRFKDEKIGIEYGNFLTNTLINILKNLSQEDNLNTIMQEFIRRIKLNNYSNLEPLGKYINMFETNLEKLVEVRNEDAIIDKTNYSFKIKIILLEIYKYHIEKVISNLNDFYNRDKVKVFGLKIIDQLKNRLESILERESEINYFKENLYLETKDLFIKNYYNKEFDFFKFKNYISEDIVYSLDEIEKEIFVEVIADMIIDLDNKEFASKFNTLYFRDIASKYCISISEVIDRIEAVKLKIGEFRIEEPKLIR